MSGDERRAGILRAARAEFARSGYHGASTACIASAAGCSEPMLYKHFASKLDLFTAALEDVSAAMESAIDEVLESGDPIQRWIEFLPTAMSSPLYAEMVGLRKLAVTICDEPGVRRLLADSMDRLRERVQIAITRGKSLGVVRDDVDPEYVAWMWLGITLTASYRNSVEGDGAFAELLPHAMIFIRSIGTA